MSNITFIALYYFSGFFYIYCFCCGSISFILNGSDVLCRTARLAGAGKRVTVFLGAYSILSVVSMAILIIRLIFSAASTLALSSNANIFDSALMNLFCRCHCLKFRQILLVQSQIFDLKNQIFRLLSPCRCFP